MKLSKFVAYLSKNNNNMIIVQERPQTSQVIWHDDKTFSYFPGSPNKLKEVLIKKYIRLGEI
jgi:hypothetical protein